MKKSEFRKLLDDGLRIDAAKKLASIVYDEECRRKLFDLQIVVQGIIKKNLAGIKKLRQSS